MLHTKMAILDDVALVGSSNMNSRSLLHDLEADVVLSDNNSLDILVNKFLLDLENSEEILQSNFKYPIWKYILGKIFSIFRYWF